MVRKHRLENVAHGAAGGFCLRQCDVALNVGGEDDFRHGLRSPGRLRVAIELNHAPPDARMLRPSASFLGLVSCDKKRSALRHGAEHVTTMRRIAPRRTYLPKR